MTAIGLFVAVPAVIGYNWLLRRNKQAAREDEALRRRPAHVPGRRQTHRHVGAVAAGTRSRRGTRHRVTCVTRLAGARLGRTHELRRHRVPVRRRAFAARQGARRGRSRPAQAARARSPAVCFARYASRRRGLRTRRGTAARLRRPGRRSGRQHRAGLETSQRLARHRGCLHVEQLLRVEPDGNRPGRRDGDLRPSAQRAGRWRRDDVARPVHGRRRRLLHRCDDACAQPLHSRGARGRPLGRGRGHRSSSTRRVRIAFATARRSGRDERSTHALTSSDDATGRQRPGGRRVRAPADHCRESRGDAAGLRRACEHLCSCARTPQSITVIRIAHAPPICDGASLALIGGSDWLASPARSHRRLRRVAAAIRTHRCSRASARWIAYSSKPECSCAMSIASSSWKPSP